jgi:probable HAF family extracellular repeat protein
LYSDAIAINDLGQVTGDAENPKHIHAFRTAPNRRINPATDDLGTLGGIFSRGCAINDRGQVAGWSDTEDGETHAFRTAPNQPINPVTDDLGSLIGGHEVYAWGINNAGYVVGRSTVSHIFWGSPRRVGNVVIPPEWRAFLHDGKQMLDLNTLILPNCGWVLYEARDINDRGQIVGDGICPEGYLHGFLLTPVPEPGQLVLLGIATALSGLGFLGLQSRQGG